jgi:subtilisin family serine protease
MLSTVALLSLLPWAAFGAPVLRAREETLDRYIVVLKPDVESVASVIADLVDAPTLASIAEHHIYEHGDFKGFAAPLDPQHLVTLQVDPRVAYLEADGVAHTHVVVKKRDDQSDSTWGLGRISHRENGSRDYVYDSTGAGTCAYTIDTGVYAEHPDFEGRASQVMSYTGVDTDDNGHGIDPKMFHPKDQLLTLH